MKIKVNEYNIKSFKLYSKDGTLLKNKTDLNTDEDRDLICGCIGVDGYESVDIIELYNKDIDKYQYLDDQLAAFLKK